MLETPINKYQATVLLGVCELIGATLCVLLVRYTGKRPLVLLSLIVSALCFSSTGLYARYYGISPNEPGNESITENYARSTSKLADEDPSVLFIDTRAINGLRIDQPTIHLNQTILKETDPTPAKPERMTWIPLALLLTCALFTHIGIGIIPWALIGEMYPANVRSGGSGLSSGSGYLFAFFSNKLFLWMIETLTLPGTFLFYSSVSIVGCIFFYFALPETEGKTLLEIEAHFARQRVK